ncbi:MAG: ribosome biogenesis GTP-binding protein YihA/YsxC [Oxalobacter sp.]
MSKLWQARFFTTANHLRELPKLDVPEIAFVGRSNAGKSSAINILCNQKGLAYASKTPGRTQFLNFFSVGGAHPAQHRKDPTDVSKIEMFLVDLPGYGYAQVPHASKDHWNKLLGDYLMQRSQLKGVVLMMDSRHPFQKLDTELVEWFAATGKPIHCLLTKSDKLSRSEAAKSLRLTQTVFNSYVDTQGQPFPFTVQLFSSVKRVGLEEATQKILQWAGVSDIPAKGESQTAGSKDGLEGKSVDRQEKPVSDKPSSVRS